MAAAAVDKVPGLDRLTPLLSIKVNQTSSGGYYGCNYAVLSNDEVLFNLIEESHTRSMFASGRLRPFQIDGVDNAGKKLFTIRRQAAFMSDQAELYIDDALVSVIRVEPTFMTPIFSINDAQNRPTLRVKGRISDPSHFQLQTTTKINIGSIDKRWLGWGRELTSLKNDYILLFPADLALHFKVAIIATCVFIDFKFFEGK